MVKWRVGASSSFEAQTEFWAFWAPLITPELRPFQRLTSFPVSLVQQIPLNPHPHRPAMLATLNDFIGCGNAERIFSYQIQGGLPLHLPAPGPSTTLRGASHKNSTSRRITL